MSYGKTEGNAHVLIVKSSDLKTRSNNRPMKYILRTTVLIALLVMASGPLNAGRYAGDFMEIGSGVRALGLGKAFAAVADDGSAIFWNPAGISQLKRIEVGLMRSFLYEGLAYYDHLTYCQPLPNDVTIGVNWTRLSIPDVPVFDEKHLIGTTIDQRVTYPHLQLTGEPDDTFTATDDLVQFAFSRHIKYDLNLGWVFFELPVHLHFGGNVKYIRRTIQDYTGTGTGFDLAVLQRNYLSEWFDVRWLGELSIGLTLRDIGNTSISWDTVSRHSDEVLMNTDLGFAYLQDLPAINSNLLIATDTQFHTYGQMQRYGAEISYDDLLAFRLGYNEDSFSTGMSVSLFDLHLDYALVTNVLGNSHRIGLRANF